MLYNKVLKGKTVNLRMLELSDCKQYYLDWLNDIDVNQFLETRWRVQSLESIKEFVTSVRESDHSYIFAITYKDKHVGNIKIGPINSIHKYADISYFIGDKSVWGRGIASEAIKLVCDFAFKMLKLNRLCAGAYQPNVGSQKVLLKNKFTQEGVKRKQYIYNTAKTLEGKEVQLFVDGYQYGLLASEYEKR